MTQRKVYLWPEDAARWFDDAELRAGIREGIGDHHVVPVYVRERGRPLPDDNGEQGALIDVWIVDHWENATNHDADAPLEAIEAACNVALALQADQHMLWATFFQLLGVCSADATAGSWTGAAKAAHQAARLLEELVPDEQFRAAPLARLEEAWTLLAALRGAPSDPNAN